MFKILVINLGGKIMKRKKIKYLFILFAISLMVSCYDREIIDSKEFNHFMPPVENVALHDATNTVTLSWTVPSEIPEDIVRPVRIEIQVVENGIYRQKVTLSETDPNHADIKVVAGKPYRFIVKMASSIKNENRVKGESDQIYSKGVIVTR